jgi:hypothetical protein
MRLKAVVQAGPAAKLYFLQQGSRNGYKGGAEKLASGVLGQILLFI